VKAAVEKDESSEAPVSLTVDLKNQQRTEAKVTEEVENEKELVGSPETTSGLHKRSVKYSGLKGNPLSCGVNSATESYELPSPAVAARNLVEQVQFAHLCTIMSNKHHRRAGYPFGTLVDFVCDGSGFPILRLSSLAVPSRNVMENPHSSIVVQMPGWSGLTNARVTIFGDIYQLPAEMEPVARELFLRQPSSETNILTGNTLYFRMHDIKDIYFVGGFGTVQWIDVKDYISAQPDQIISACTSAELQSLNLKFGDDLRRVLSQKSPVHEVELISVDAIGADVRTRTGGEYGVVRVGFKTKVTTIEEAKEAFTEVVSSFNLQRRKQA